MSKAAATLAEAVLQKREKLKAYHGSPHDFDQFSTENIGTGEGAQAYGYGLYFAEREGTARSYRDALTQPKFTFDGKPADAIYTNEIRERWADVYDELIDDNVVQDWKLSYLDSVAENGGDYDKASEVLDSLVEKVLKGEETTFDFDRLDEFKSDVDPNGVYDLNEPQRHLDTVLANMSQADSPSTMDFVLSGLTPDERRIYERYVEPKVEFIKPEGKMYEVDIDASPDELLDYDLPLTQQSETVKAALRKVDNDPKLSKPLYLQGTMEDIINAPKQSGGGLLSKFRTELRGDEQASAFLSNLGIKGIKYKDQFSRVGSGETNNYVIFDDRLIEISKQYGVSIPVAAAILGGTMTTSEARAQDDITGEFLEERQNANVSFGDQLLAQVEMEQADQETRLLEKAGDAAEVVGDVASDVARGISETPQQIIGGLLDAVQEAAYTMESMFPVGGIAIGDDIDEYWGIPGFMDMTVDERYEALSQLPKKVSQADSTTGDIVRDIAAFTSMFLPANRAATAAGAVKSSPFIAGFIADAAAFNAFEGRLSNLIQDYDGLANPVTEFLASNEDDSLLMAKFKAALEGLGLGAAAEGFVKSVTVYKKAKEVKRIAQQNNQTAEDLITDVAAENPQLSIDMGIEEGEFIPLEQLADEAGAVIKIPPIKGGEQALDDVKNINLNNLETTDDVKNLIDKVAEASPVETDLARRGKINNQTTEALANDLGMSVEDLLTRRAGVAFNAEEALASRQILVASGENLVRLARTAAQGTDADLVLFRRAMAQHQAIQLQVSGLTAEAGRALQSFRIKAKGQQEQLRAIDELLSTSGGVERSKQMAQMMSTFTEPGQVGKFIKQAGNAKYTDMLYEVWINSLLSNPATHAVNAISNTLVPLLSTSERVVASWMGSGVKDRESAMMLMGMVRGAQDGMRLAWQSFKTGRPSDTLDKVEVDERAAISSKNLNKTGAIGRFADYFGTVVRFPGRLLTTSDEFFKAVGYRMELNAQAYRTAVNEGLEGEGLAKRIYELVENPPENLHLAAVDFKRYQTFTNELGRGGKKIEGLRNYNLLTRTIMPFVRTPVNIMTFTVERTPLAILSQTMRDEIFSGPGARRDLALGKMAVGSMIMASAADLALQGEITGGGPTDKAMRNIMRQNGWQPYSIKINGTYYAFNRLDPVGSFLGLAADIVEITGQLEEVDVMNLSTSAVLSVVQNLASKTYLSGVSEFFDAIISSSPDAEGNNYKLERYAERMLSTVVPSVVGQIERVMSPELSATYGVMDRIKSRLPGYSKDLKPRRNVFGEVVVLEGGLGPDIMSPIYTSTQKYDPVVEALVENSIPIRMPRERLGGTKLTPDQYDRYVLLQAGEGRDVSLNEALKKAIKTRSFRNALPGPDGRRNQIIMNKVADYRQYARKKLQTEFPELKQALKFERERSQR